MHYYIQHSMFILYIQFHFMYFIYSSAGLIRFYLYIFLALTQRQTDGSWLPKNDFRSCGIQDLNFGFSSKNQNLRNIFNIINIRFTDNSANHCKLHSRNKALDYQNVPQPHLVVTADLSFRNRLPSLPFAYLHRG